MTDEERKLAEDNMKLVYFVINKFYPQYSQDEDVASIGMIGLLKAAEMWEPSKGAFSTIATTAIKSEIRNELRKRRAKGRDDKENRAETCVKCDGEELDVWGMMASPDNIARECEQRLDVRRAMEKLPSRHAEMMMLYYGERMSFSEIGKLYRISMQRVDQIIKNSRRRLKHELGESYKD